MWRFRMPVASFLLILLVSALRAFGQADEAAPQDWRALVGPEKAPDAIAPIEAPFDMPQLARPAFPDVVFNITDFGAVGDGLANNRQAINAAIDACTNAGGGTVLVPAGEWLTGAIQLKSNVNLHLAEGAILRFSIDPKDYLPTVFTRWAGFECINYSPLIYANNSENIAITGPGTIDGNGESWWPWAEYQEDTAKRMYREQILKGVPPEERIYGTPEAGLRPQMISPINCRNVLLEGFTIAKPGPFWTIDLVYCDRVIVRKLRVFTVGGPNTDGINVDSCRNVLIEHCDLNTGDDCICMKSGMNEDGWRVAKPAENVVIRYNRTAQGHGGAVFGSDMSGDIRNVYVHSCVYEGTALGIRLKSTRGRGGVVEKLWFDNIDMKDIQGEAIQMTTAYSAWMGTTEGKAPTFRDLQFNNIRVNGARYAARLEGLPEALLREIRMQNVVITAKEGFSATLVDGIQLERVLVHAENGPAFQWEQCQLLTIDGETKETSGTLGGNGASVP
ncbi:MAG: glycoside hydrolase family 28 protein [Candidatus Hydrogenedentes bacterium]|nr:glycoside hydrolase family 28 protein [Candidatus Hydrogenedentota bacterium]